MSQYPTQRTFRCILRSRWVSLFGATVSFLSPTYVTSAIAADDNRTPAIEITPRTSRPQVSAGSKFGVTVDIHNKSEVAVYLSPKFFTMCLPPELDSRAPFAWWAIFPGGAEKEEPYERVIKLLPGETVAAIWAGSSRLAVSGGFWAQQYHSFSEEFRLITFQPGDYAIRIVANYWTDEASVGKPLKDSHSETVEIKIPIVAPQWVIIFGALIGGLIAYFLLPRLRINPQHIDVSGVATALLLSVIVTILLSRISDTQFFIKVSVNDLWGAIAVGFLGCASGTNIIKRFLPAEGLERASAVRPKKSRAANEEAATANERPPTE